VPNRPFAQQTIIDIPLCAYLLGATRIAVAATPKSESYDEDHHAGVFAIVRIGAGRAISSRAKDSPQNGSASLEQKCREEVGKEQNDGEGRGGAGRLQAQRFGDCMSGMQQH
jgi:hypothetical protein